MEKVKKIIIFINIGAVRNGIVMVERLFEFRRGL